MENCKFEYSIFLPSFDSEWQVTRFCAFDKKRNEITFDWSESQLDIFKLLLINKVIGDVNTLVISSGLMTINDPKFIDFIKPIFTHFGSTNKIDIIYDFYD